MARNSRTPGGGTPRALENVASQADETRDTAPHHTLQAERIGRSFKFSPEVAAVLASLAFDVPEHWGRRA